MDLTIQPDLKLPVDTKALITTDGLLGGQAVTVMVGDFMFAHAAELVARTGNIEVIRLFARSPAASQH